MLAESVIAIRDTLKAQDRPFRLFFDNAEIVNSLTDVISWNDDKRVLHVIRASMDATIQKYKPVEILTFGYEDIRSMSYYINTNEISSEMEKLAGIGATEFSKERGDKIQEHYAKLFNDVINSQY